MVYKRLKSSSDQAGIATRYGLDGPVFKPRWRREIP